MHWMVGTLASTDAVFKNPNSGVSAHYGVEGSKVHQYVQEKDTAWHAISANPFSIGIEHSAAPGRPPSKSTYATSIELCVKLCKKYGLTEVDIVPHCLYVATRCAGTDKTGKVREAGGVDIVYIRKEVKKRLTTAPKPTPKPTVIPTYPKTKAKSGTVTIKADKLNARSRPYVDAPIKGTFVKGTAKYTAITKGDVVRGYNGKISNVWLRSLGGNWFSAAWTSY